MRLVHLAVALAIVLAGCGRSPNSQVASGFSIDPVTNHDAPMKARFKAHSEGEVKEWNWTFSDGGTASGKEPEHLFKNEGEYTATLEIVYPDGYKTEMTMMGIRVKNGLRTFRSANYSVDVLDKREVYEFSLFGVTNGWVGMAFPKTLGKLEGADLYLGYVKDGVLEMADMYFHTKSETRHDEVMGGSDDAIPVDGEEFFAQNKATSIRFEVPKNSPDRFDVPLKPGKYSVWVGIGSDNAKNFDSGAVDTEWIEIELP